MGKELRMNKKRLASAITLMGAAALTVTTVVFAAGPSGGMGAPGGAGGQIDTVEKSQSVIEVNVESPTTGSIVRNTEFIGKVETADSVSVYPSASGKIDEIYFEAGQTVQSGDLLMKLDSDDLEFDLKVAQASYDEKMVSANKTLGSDYTSKIISAQNTLDKANRSYRTARQSYATEANVEDDALEKADDKRIAAKEARDTALATWNQTQLDYQQTNGTTEGMEDDPTVKAAHTAYQEAYEKYRDADEEYYALTDEYDDSTSAAVASKDNAYKDVTQAKESLELTTGTAYSEQLAVIEASLVSAQLSLQKAERALDKTYVYSPVSGVIETRTAEAYGTASTNTAAFTIANEDDITITFNASSDGAAALALGDTVTITKGTKTFEATIIEIDSKADSATGLFPIKASLESDGTLLSGISVKVSAATAKAENALMIPIDAIYYEEGQAYVFTYEGGKALRTDIQTGMSDAETMVVTEGLTESSQIITTWHPDLKNNATVSLKGQTTQAGSTADAQASEFTAGGFKPDVLDSMPAIQTPPADATQGTPNAQQTPEQDGGMKQDDTAKVSS